MSDTPGKIWKWLPWIVSGLVTLFFFHDVLLHPGSAMLSTDGDASKNYFTFIYHSLYGEGIWFDGMNYPYGEHIVFTDAQPAFVVPFSILNDYLHINPLMVMHLLLVAGFFTAILYVYKILILMNVHQLWALTGAVLVVAMSPQQFKLDGHFTLAYFCVLPIVFYYNLAWYKSGKWAYIVALFFASVIFSFIHLYFALMICLWMVLYSIGYVIFQKVSLHQKFKHLWPVLFAGIVPLLLFSIFMRLTDVVTDRPVYPYGARAHGSVFGDIVTSYLSPLSIWFSKWIDTGTLSGGNEGYAYIGFAPLLIILFGFVGWMATLLFRKRTQFFTADSNGTIIWFFIAGGVLLFSSAIIFKKCFVCLDYASFIRQFRAIGRFSWMFYYIITIVSVATAYRWYVSWVNNGKRNFAFLFSVILLLIWMAEAIPFAIKTHKLSSDAVVQYKLYNRIPVSDWKGFFSEHGYTSDSFRALYVLPYFHIGTEKLGHVPCSYNLTNMAFSTSLQLHLPLMNVMMSRTSWQQAFQLVKVSGGPYTHKKVLQSRDYRPVLLVHPEQEPLNPDEQYLLSSAQLLGNLHGNNVYALYTADLLKQEAISRESYDDVFYDIGPADSCIKYAGPWYVEHYDTGTSTEVLMGKGAARAIDGITDTVFSDALTPMYDKQLYEFSAWMLVSNKDYKIGRFVIYLYDENNNLVYHTKVLAQESVDNYGLWLRVSKYFEVPATTGKIAVQLVNIIYPSYLALDELMIRPADALIISKSADARRMVNNHVLPY